MRVLAIAIPMAVVCTSAYAATPVVDNERVTVWDVPLSKGESAAPTPTATDSVTMFLEGGTITTRHADGSVTTATRKFGDAVFNPKGSASVDTAGSDGVHEIVIALKDFRGPPPKQGPAGIPNAFPRAGAEKTLEGPGFIVWRTTWTPNVPVPMHFHDKETVMVFRSNGVLKSTGLDGKATDGVFKQGQISFARGGNSHTETLTTERESAVDLELK